MHTLTFKGFYSSGLGEQVLIVGHHLCIKNVQELGTTQGQPSLVWLSHDSVQNIGCFTSMHYLFYVPCSFVLSLPPYTCEYSSLSSAAIPLASFWRVSPTIWHWMVVVANVLASKSSRRRGCSEAERGRKVAGVLTRALRQKTRHNIWKRAEFAAKIHFYVLYS